MQTSTDIFIGYVGTYTKGESKGIYSFALDTAAGKITELDVVATLGNPTYLCMSKDRRYLYSVIKEGEAGGVAAFAISEDCAKLRPLNTRVEEGAPPCHVSTNDSGSLLFSANYHKGTVQSYRIDESTGTITPPVSTIKHEGHGPDSRQEKPHTHFAGMTPDNKYLAVVELGSDWLITYGVSDHGELGEVSRLKVRPGSGPRHLVFHPTSPSFAYVMTEFSSEVIVLSYSADDGKFAVIETVTTLPADFTENNQGSAIHISSDGRFVYAGNRGHNSIAVFQTDEESGKLHFVERVSTEGDWPRDFVLDPTEKFLVASNQNSSNLVLFARDAKTGRLTLVQKDIVVPDPVCIKF